jgi:hypothetical protein
MRVLLGVALVLMAMPAIVGALLLIDTLFGLAYGLTAVFFEGMHVRFTSFQYSRGGKYSAPTLPAIRS